LVQESEDMSLEFTLEYWIDDGWFVGRLREVPGVFSQGESLEELEANIRDAYGLMVREEAGPLHPGARVKSIAVDAA
jgi:predicted RNase H-like HicB family nuclease